MSVANKKPLKILIGCLFFRDFTGSEVYVYELAKKLRRLGHNVTVTSPFIDGILGFFARSNDINVVPFAQLSVYDKYDIIHAQHHPVTVELLKLFKNTPFVSTIHSELLELENPAISNQIKKYVAIRPEIKAHLNKNFGIAESQVEIIFNPVDEERFNLENTQSFNNVLFVGTIDYLRKNAIFDMVNQTKNNNQDFWLVGKNQSDYLPEILKYSHVKYSWECHDVEKYTKLCGQTAGILLGRTTIEGWLCGKPGWIYEIDQKGTILNKQLHSVPQDVGKFKSIHVAEQMQNLYWHATN